MATNISAASKVRQYNTIYTDKLYRLDINYTEELYNNP